MGLSCCPPDSRCKRFDVDNAWLKSERFLNGPPVSPDLIVRDPPILSVVKIFCFWHSIGEILFCKIVPVQTNIFISIMFEQTLTKKHDLARNDHGSLWILFWRVSFSNYGPDDSLFFLECGHEVFPSWLRTLELREGAMNIQWNLDWPQFLSRDAHMYNRRCLHSNMTGILCTAS